MPPQRLFFGFGGFGLATNQATFSTRFSLFRVNWRWLLMGSYPGDVHKSDESFVWRQGKDLITLSRAGDSWQVSCLTQGRLLGPKLKVYEAMHRTAKFAAWDVMAKVISVTHDEDAGVEVAVSAAQWMRTSGTVGA